jgi:ABC-2 type transport system permease protein
VSGTFAPSPGAAPVTRQVWSHGDLESRLLLRNGEQLLLALGIPLLALVAGTAVENRLDLAPDTGGADLVTPGVLALAVMSTAFTSLAIATGFERRSGVLKWLGVSPLPRGALLAGKALALVLVLAVQFVVMLAVGAWLGLGAVTWLGAAAIVAALLLGTAAFAGLGLALAGTLRAEATLAAANLVYLVLLVGGGVLVPRTAYGAAADWLRVLPSAALGDAMRAATIDHAVAWGSFGVLVAWAAGGTLLAVRCFRWE